MPKLIGGNPGLRTLCADPMRTFLLFVLVFLIPGVVIYFNNKSLGMGPYILPFFPRFASFFLLLSLISLPKFKKIQPLVDFYRFLIVLLGCISSGRQN